MDFIIEKLDALPQDIFDECFTSSTPYLAEALKLDLYEGTDFDDDELRTILQDQIVKLRDYLQHFMAEQPVQVIIKNAADGRVQTLMSGDVSFAGTFHSPYNLHNPDENGSRAYLYKSQTEYADNLEAAFNAVGINNVRVSSGSDSQANHALATGWVEDTNHKASPPDGVNKLRSFRTPWGWA